MISSIIYYLRCVFAQNSDSTDIFVRMEDGGLTLIRVPRDEWAAVEKFARVVNELIRR